MNDDQFLDFEMNGEIIAVIKQHKANTATMAREIVSLRAEVRRLKSDLADTEADYKDRLRDAVRAQE